MTELAPQKDAMDVLQAWSPAEGQVSIFHLVAISRNGRPAILVQRFDGPTADTAVQAGLWASKQLGRR